MASQTPEQKSQGSKWLFIVGGIILFIVFAYGIFAAPSEPAMPETENPTSTADDMCDDAGGTWIEGYEECEFVDAITCDAMGGEFNECGSACRHATEPGPCTLQCVPFCAL